MNTSNDKRNYDRDRNQQDRDQSENRSSEGQGGDRRTDDHNHHSDDSSTRDLEMRWQEIENNYKRRYPNLSEAELEYSEGEFNAMTDRIAKRTNRSRQEVHDEIWEWDSDNFDGGDTYDRE